MKLADGEFELSFPAVFETGPAQKPQSSGENVPIWKSARKSYVQVAKIKIPLIRRVGVLSGAAAVSRRII
jgi:hypothetical protein